MPYEHRRGAPTARQRGLYAKKTGNTQGIARRLSEGARSGTTSKSGSEPEAERTERGHARPEKQNRKEEPSGFGPPAEKKEEGPRRRRGPGEARRAIAKASGMAEPWNSPSVARRAVRPEPRRRAGVVAAKASGRHRRGWAGGAAVAAGLGAAGCRRRARRRCTARPRRVPRAPEPRTGDVASGHVRRVTEPREPVRARAQPETNRGSR